MKKKTVAKHRRIWYTDIAKRGRHPSQKTAFANRLSYTQGMIPIEKNITVVDEQGNDYEPTYPKRAKGLVKHGRARFVDEHTICLACPPYNETEEPIMEEQTVLQQPEVATEPTATGISLTTALRLLATISRNINEPTAFWASKTAYSGVYRTAVKNGWIEDGLFVTDIPEGVDGGFLAADMRRVALMANLLSDVLSDRLSETDGAAPQPAAPACTEETIRAAVQEQIREYFSEHELDAVLGDALSETLDELEALKDEILEEIEAAKDE